MEYWRNPGTWNVSVDINLTTGVSNFTNATFIYDPFPQAVVNVSTINFTGLPGQTVNSTNAFPLNVSNIGNQRLDIYINGTDFVGEEQIDKIVGVSNATYNETVTGIFRKLTYNRDQVYTVDVREEKLLYFNASLPIRITRKKENYVSCCPVLDVWSQGETRKEAKENLQEALQLFLIDCFERGSLDKVLKDCGFTASKTLVPNKKNHL